MDASGIRATAGWSERWPRLAQALRVDPREPLLLALSGGADSVLLLHWLRLADTRPPLVAVHVDHGLRGAESEGDARFCADLCRDFGVPFRLRRAPLDRGPGLEERARIARYAALLDEARRARVRLVLTGHQADDDFETVMMRWLRGSELAGLRGIEPLRERADGRWRVQLVRPLIGLRRAEVRRLAEQAGLRWREDSSNLDPSFARNRVRDLLLPRMAEIGGEAAVEELRRFAEVVERLERDLAARTAELCWRPLAARHATRRHDDGALGGVLRRAALSRLPAALRRRALWRLVVEGTTRAPGRRLLALLERDIEHEKCARHTLPGGWSLVLRKESMELHPPAEFLALAPRQPWLPFPERAPRAERPRSAAWVARTQSPREAVVLPVPGSVTLTDGRRIVCEVTSGPADRPVPRDPKVVELDASALPSHLLVRAPVEGDRFHPLGAPGSRPLRRFLADARVPRGERRLVPLVLDGERIVWVAGLRVAQASRVVATSRVRLRLELHGGPRGASDAPDASTAASAGPASRQLELPFERGAPGSAG